MLTLSQNLMEHILEFHEDYSYTLGTSQVTYQI